MWKKVIAPAVAVSLVWLVGSTISTSYIARIEESQDRLLVENVTSIRAAHDMETTLWRMQSLLLDSSPEIGEVVNEWRQLSKRFLSSLDEAEAVSRTPEEHRLVDDIRVRFVAYAGQGHASIFNDAMSSQSDQREVLQLAEIVADSCQQLMSFNDNIVREATQLRQTMTSTLYLVRMSFLLIGPALGLYLGYRVATGLNRSIMQISIRLKDAAGELQHEVGRLELTPQADLPAVQRQVEVVSDRIRDVLQELQHVRQEAMRHERLAAVGGLAAGVAHEIRNPLTSVKLLIQHAIYRRNSSLNGKTLEVVLEEIGRMEATIQSLLDFARPPQLRRKRHDLRDTVRRAINLIEGRAKQQSVRFECDFPSEPVWIDGDSDQLHQVCVNLLLNGVESMSSGGELKIRIEQQSHDLAIIEFRDTGAGIPAPILPRLFEPFASTKERGTGLGLAVSRRIVQEHAGRLIAANRSEGGAEFLVELPLAKSELQQSVAPTATA